MCWYCPDIDEVSSITRFVMLIYWISMVDMVTIFEHRTDLQMCSVFVLIQKNACITWYLLDRNVSGAPILQYSMIRQLAICGLSGLVDKQYDVYSGYHLKSQNFCSLPDISWFQIIERIWNFNSFQSHHYCYNWNISIIRADGHCMNSIEISTFVWNILDLSVCFNTGVQ